MSGRDPGDESDAADRRDVIGAGSQSQPLPVSGYTSQSADKIALVNVNKLAEERLLRVLDGLAGRDDVDKRWLSIGRTAIEQGFMAVNRAIFQPTRVATPERES